MLLWLFNPYDVKWLVVIALVLLSLGTSGSNLLQEILENLVNDIDKSQDKTKTRTLARAAIWSCIAYVSGAISAILWVAPDAIWGVNPSWRSSFLICICTMTVTSMIFCIGHKMYHQGVLTERPLKVFLRVFCLRIKELLKCNSRCLTNFSRQESSPQNLEIEMGAINMQERWPQHLYTNRNEARGRSSYTEDMMVVKSLLRMFPMWGMFFVVALISATGSTFFLQQYNNLKSDTKIAIQIYNVLQDFSNFAIPFLYRWICGSRKNEKVKIGVGMFCGIISCIFAWRLEVYRLKEVNRLVYKDANTSISFLWLVPQFCVLGCMEGLTREGLLNFYRSQVKKEPLQSYGDDYIEIVMSFGKLLTIFLILIFQSQLGWFGATINDSRLDKYYLFLVFLCSANFIAYCCIARFYYKDAERHPMTLGNGDLNEENDTAQQQHSEDTQQQIVNDYGKAQVQPTISRVVRVPSRRYQD